MFGIKWLTPEMLALGGLAAATGGAALPAVAGAAGVAPAVAGSGITLGGVNAATAAASAAKAAAAPVAEAGLLGSAKAFGTQAMGYATKAGEVLKPFGQAASAANAVSSMFPQSQPVQTPAPNFGGGAGSQAFTGLLQDSMNTEQMRAQEEMQRRQAQQKLIGLIGGM